jgi:hypothetical protein
MSCSALTFSKYGSIRQMFSGLELIFSSKSDGDVIILSKGCVIEFVLAVE